MDPGGGSAEAVSKDRPLIGEDGNAIAVQQTLGPAHTRTGGIEPPLGERAEGSSTRAVYTEEQQSRLKVDEDGKSKEDEQAMADERKSNQDAASAAVEGEKARKKSIDQRSDMNEQMLREKNQKQAAKDMDDEKLRRESMDQRSEMNEQMLREKNQKQAAKDSDDEKARREAMDQRSNANAQMMREANIKAAVKGKDEEQKRRATEDQAAVTRVELERTMNQKKADREADGEQKRRVEEDAANDTPAKARRASVAIAKELGENNTVVKVLADE